MNWKVMAILPEMQPFSEGSRRWPFFALLLAVVLLGSSSWLYYRTLPTYTEQIAGNEVILTRVDMMFNPFGENYTYEKAEEILQCTSKGWVKSSSIGMPAKELNVLSSNATLLSSEGITSLPLNDSSPQSTECPSYFRWIQRDLAPWKAAGITKASIDDAATHAALRFVIVDSKLYVVRYARCFENRAVFTVWGILLFLEKYKGRVPDVEFVLNCEDQPRIAKSDVPIPLFSYCSNDEHYDMPFPDWSFWGWSELLIDSWDREREEIVQGSAKVDWSLKAPWALWSGNPYVGSPNRYEMLQCHGANKTEIHIQDWRKEISNAKQNSKLEDQCTHRYMIYAEGIGWSVSLKYIFACGSPVLAISPTFYDFFSRGLEPFVHFIPVRPSEVRAPELCQVLDKQVEFGETNTTRAREIGKAGQDFMRKELDMVHVYDYMFHLLREYSLLQKFRPSIPESAHLVTLDHVLCIAEPGATSTLQQAFKIMPRTAAPCHLSETSGDGFKEADWLVKQL